MRLYNPYAAAGPIKRRAIVELRAAGAPRQQTFGAEKSAYDTIGAIKRCVRSTAHCDLHIAASNRRMRAG